MFHLTHLFWYETHIVKVFLFNGQRNASSKSMDEPVFPISRGQLKTYFTFHGMAEGKILAQIA